ncbi:MAG: DNA recombination protein RmuC [Clostridia bacterium]|nr:DNA recombination protein RmuC [Clostridia bacterium]
MGMEYVILLILALAIAILVLLIVLLTRKNGGQDSARLDSLSDKLDAVTKSVSDEMSKNRAETNSAAARQREELTKSLENMNENIYLLRESNIKNKSEMLESVNNQLNIIRDKQEQQSRLQAEALTKGMEQLRSSNEKKLDEMRATVDEKLSATLTQRLDSSFKTVSEQLENLYKSLGEMKELSSGVTANVTTLNRVLTNVKARGTWAEVQLQGILDQTIPNMYERNVATGESSTERVEFAIKIPASDDPGKYILLPVDSKFPVEDYVRLCDAADSADAEALQKARKALEDRVENEAKMITKYICVPNTTPFAIMYLATEGLYAEIASSRTGLPERLQQKYNIMIAGPTTITALLNSLSMGFKTVAINEKANEVRLLLEATKAQYATFTTVLEKARKKIDEAGRTLDDAQHRNSIINKKLKGVESMDAEKADGVFGLLESGE